MSKELWFYTNWSCFATYFASYLNTNNSSYAYKIDSHFGRHNKNVVPKETFRDTWNLLLVKTLKINATKNPFLDSFSVGLKKQEINPILMFQWLKIRISDNNVKTSLILIWMCNMKSLQKRIEVNWKF